MTSVYSNSDAFLFTIPMLVVLFMSFFKLDQIISRPTRTVRQPGRPLSQWSADGVPMCIEPDGRIASGLSTRSRGISCGISRNGAESISQAAGRDREKAACPLQRRVAVEWMTEENQPA